MIIAAILLTRLALAWDQRPNSPISACADELPRGVPTSTSQGTLRCNEGYAFLHDDAAKISVWTAWTLLPEETIGCNPREDAFIEDLALPVAARARPSDYLKTGFDRGHMAPDADMSWSKQTSMESFLMSNMSPQYPNLNRGVWKQLEAQTRAWAWTRKHPLTVYSGNIYKVGTSKTIGEGKVTVPDALYKIVVDTVTGEVLAFHFPNVEKLPTDISLRLTTVGTVERLSGVTFPMPPGFDKGQLPTGVWPGSQGEVAEAKKAACKGKR